MTEQQIVAVMFILLVGVAATGLLCIGVVKMDDILERMTTDNKNRRS